MKLTDVRTMLKRRSRIGGCRVKHGRHRRHENALFVTRLMAGRLSRVIVCRHAAANCTS